MLGLTWRCPQHAHVFEPLLSRAVVEEGVGAFGPKILWPLGAAPEGYSLACSWSCLYPDMGRCEEPPYHIPATESRVT